MTIPEPTDEILSYDLQQRYELLKKCGGATGYIANLVRRAYHAERERDALRQWKETQSKFHTELLNQYEKLEKETDALRTKLHDSDRIGTHYDGCWDSGPRHYTCAIAEIATLRARVVELEYHLKTLNAAIDIAHPHIARMIYKRSRQLKAKGVAGE